MKMNHLERALVRRFCELNRITSTALPESLDLIDVTERDFTGVGVYVTFASHPCLRIGSDVEKNIAPGPGAFLNAERVLIGSLFYIDSGYLTTIECYTYGDESWPDKITCCELTDG